MPPGLEKDSQSHNKEGQPIDKNDQGAINREKFAHRFHNGKHLIERAYQK
jgi:hypothetical protein